MIRSLFPRTPSLSGTDVSVIRERLCFYFHSTFDCYEELFQVLSCDEAYYKKPISLRHPLIFYFGHTATFFINKLILAGLIQQRVNPRFESLFAVGVDEMSWDDLNEAHYHWPTVAEVKRYRDQVREVVDSVIRTAPLNMPLDWKNPWWAIPMGIEHERIHLETSSVLIRQHELKYVKPHEHWQPCRQTGPAPNNEMVNIPASSVNLGKDKGSPYYGWDNEYGHHTADVAAFQASRYLVSNGEFLQFVEAGGYADETVWEEEGLGWKKFAEATHPTFWVTDAGAWKLRLMLEEVAMPWDWPVEVNYHEAKAFCNWKAKITGKTVRLPTEDEWQCLFAQSSLEEVLENIIAPANIHLDHFASPCPVNHYRHGQWYDVLGNVWQWTETPVYPFDGFDVHPLYDDFTTPTYDNRHAIIKGGSWISCGNEAISSSRYAFRRHFFQHAGFRYVVSNAPVTQVASNYVTDLLLSSHLEQHYGDKHFGVPNFMQTLAEFAIQSMGDRPAHHALDIGCSMGRASFELAKHFEQVTGLDFSARFISLADQMATQGLIRYTPVEEGELVSYQERRLADLGLDNVRHKVEFFQGDACNLKPIFKGYDLILVTHLIDRVYSPRKFLENVHERLNAGGILIIASAYDWSKEHTRREEWIGGFKKDGESYTTLDGLKDILGEHFDSVGKPSEIPFVYRETRRNFQYILKEVTVWEKKHVY